MANILVIEDNNDYREVLQNFLESDQHIVTGSADGADIVDLLKENNFDLILLDIMLPKIDGYTICSMIRKNSNVPIIMLTALGSEENQLRGFELKIDDYITKPVSMPLLLSKVTAVLRRTSKNTPDTLEFHGIRLNLKQHTVTVCGNSVEFTLREFEILTELMSAPGEVVTRKFLLSKLWDYNFYGDARIVDTHIKNIRKKLGEEAYIETIRGMGYKLRKENF
jgi:two-component system response regulator VanR